MALLLITLRKIIKNKWFVFCMLIGLVISTALIGSIPIYTHAVLQKYLTKELESFQDKNNKFTGSYVLSVMFNNDGISKTVTELEKQNKKVLEDSRIKDFYNQRLASFNAVDKYIKDNTENLIGLPVLASARFYSIDKRMLLTDIKAKPNSDKYAGLVSMSGIEKHIKLIDGRLPSSEKVDGVYEALVTEGALKKYNAALNQVFILEDYRDKWNIPPVKVKPVGILAASDEKDPYWTFMLPDYFNEDLIINENLMVKDFIGNMPTLVYYSRWFYAFDYHAITIDKLSKIESGNYKIQKDTSQMISQSKVSIDVPILEVINSYYEKSKQLTNMLWALNVPILTMLCLFLFMISRMVIDQESNEIALLSSRGASRLQIVSGYAVEGIILCLIALVLGLGSALGLCRILGASNGFLEFANRKALPIALNQDSFKYAIYGLIFSMIAILIPAYAASKTSIVSHKQKLAGLAKLTLWEKIFVDLILIGFSIYGYFTFTQRQLLMKATAANATDITIDPILFIVPAAFIIGSGLLCIRIYPYIIKLIYFIGRKLWSPPAYATLTQIGRSFKAYHFLMIFMVMTISIGIFSATAARTINKNSEEKIKYASGCDMVLDSRWDSDADLDNLPASMPPPRKETDLDGSTKTDFKKVNYYEPSFLQYSTLPGVAHAAKVLNKPAVNLEVNGKNTSGINLMGIDSYDFGMVAWYRKGLLDHHINLYLNLLAQEPSSCLISKSLSKKLGLKINDNFQVSWKETYGSKAILNVYGIVDYWPSWNPNKKTNNKAEAEPMLIVANLNYLQDHVGLEPYQVWLKLKPDATSKQVYDGISKAKLPVINLEDSNLQLVSLKNSPFVLAINGALTLGFIISGLVCFCGFLVFWVISIKSRTLQFGIFRAMGMKVRQLIAMMFLEQILTSGVSILMGSIIGLLSSRLFVPFFQLAFDSATQVPPFRVISDIGDRMKIYIFMGVTLSIGVLLLGSILSRIKMSQAIKLGEE